MNAFRRDPMTSIVGALTASAGALLLAAIVIPSDPLGRLIGALLAASIGVGIVGALIRASAYRSGSIRPGRNPAEIPLDMPSAPTAAATARCMEPVVCIGDRAPPAFAVASLTEARVARRRVVAPCEAAEA